MKLTASSLKKRILCNEQGFSLVGVLVGAGILGIIAAGSVSLFNMQLKNQAQYEATSTRDSLVRLLQANLSDSKAILASKEMPINLAFKHCKEGKPLPAGDLDPVGCVAKVGSERVPFDFTIFTSLGSGPISGAPGTPQTYTAQGVPCVSPGPGCVIEVRTWFVAKCANDASACATADAIEFRYKIEKAPNAEGVVMRPISGFWSETPSVAAAGTMEPAQAGTMPQFSCYGYASSNNHIKGCCALLADGTFNCKEWPNNSGPWQTIADRVPLTVLKWRSAQWTDMWVSDSLMNPFKTVSDSEAPIGGSCTKSGQLVAVGTYYRVCRYE